MSAILQVYTNQGCSDELLLAGDDYDLTLGPNTGLDGDTGDRADATLFVKNTGNKPAIGVQIIKDNDPDDRVEMRSLLPDYTRGILSVGDLMPSEAIPLYLRVTVPRGTPASLVTPTFTMKYRSLP